MTTLLSSPLRRGRTARARLLAGVALAGFLTVGMPAFAADSVVKTAVKVIPDLLELPAVRSNRAVQSMQLAIARAGGRLVSVGEAGIVLLSDDYGVTWRQATRVPVSVALTDVAFVDARRGWAVGHSGAILTTSDGGETWERQADGLTANRLMAEEAKELTDAGRPEGARAARIAGSMQDDGPDKPFLGATFFDADHGFAIGAYGMALETRDGGRSWRSIMAQLPNPAGKHLYRLTALAGGFVIVGEQGVVIASRDGGRTFENIETPYEGSFFSAIATEDGGALLVGLKGNVWRGDATLAQWRQIPMSQPVTVTAASRLDDKTIVLTDEVGRVLVSRDDGRSFSAAGAGTGAAATGVAQAGDGVLVISTARGNRRFDLKSQNFVQEAQ